MADRKPTVLNPAGYQENLQDTDNLVIEAAPTADNHAVNKDYCDTKTGQASRWKNSGSDYLTPKDSSRDIKIGDFDYATDSTAGSIINTDGGINIKIRTGNTHDALTTFLGNDSQISLKYNGDASFTGNITAAGFTGPVTGDITGDITGNIDGNVNGDVTGDLTGNVNGNVTGNLTGDVTGDVTGNLTGNVDGDVTGDLTGSVTGDVTGDLTGNVTGNVDGNVTGDLTGNVTGDLAGNADTATELKTARTIALSGDVSGSADFDGSSNITISSTVADDSHNHIISNVDGLQAALDSKLGTGDKAADSDNLDGLNSSSFLRSDTADDANGAIYFRAGAGAATIQANSDIRFENGSWTDNNCKIQHSGNILYVVGGTNGIIFREGATDRASFNQNGQFLPGQTNTYDIGNSSTRWNKIFVTTYDLENLPTLP